MMMDYSISTVSMTILTSNLLLILIALFFRSSKIMINLGYRLLAIFVCITFLRFILPFEFPFTKTIFLPENISFYIILLRHPFCFLGKYGISIWTLLEITWILGAIISCLRYIKEIRLFRNLILLAGRKPVKHDIYMSILDNICRTHGKKNAFRIRELDTIISPQICGIRKPYILLPAHLDFSDEDMYYVLSHEATHHFHHDLLLKCIVRIISIVYWWNPACHYLYKKASLLLEMRIDDTVAQNHEQATKYLNCLILLAEKMRNQHCPMKLDSISLSLAQSNRSELTQRFEMLIHRHTSHNLALNVFVFATVFLVYMSSYFYTFEAFYSPSDVEETIYITDNTSYFIQNEDGTYDLYYSNIYFETVTDLNYFPDDIPIYTREEFDKLSFQ